MSKSDSTKSSAERVSDALNGPSKAGKTTIERTELARLVDAYGLEKGVKFALAGLTFEQAREQAERDENPRAAFAAAIAN